MDPITGLNIYPNKYVQHDVQATTSKYSLKCFLLLLLNLADPVFLSVDCNKPATKILICQNNETMIADRVKQRDRICNAKSLFSRSKCLTLHWLPWIEAKRNKFLSARLPKEISRAADFGHIFLRLLPLGRYDEAVVSCSGKVAGIFLPAEPKTQTSLKSWFYEKSNPFVVNTLLNTYKCQNGTQIIIPSMCDGIKNCVDGEDEIGCTCNTNNETISTKCKFVLDGEKKQCSTWFLRQEKEFCSFVYFSSIPHQGVIRNDLDIYPPTKETTGYCTRMGAFPCKRFAGLCFYFHDVCIFKLHNRILVPCPFGTHMQYCQNFECNIMFKCPESYCIPWKYVCDSVWDCQQGEDESIDFCESEQRCLGMFMCKKHQPTQLCLHLGNICDGTEDCPFGEDEMFCVLRKIICPSLCHCHVFAISCEDGKVTLQRLFSVYQLIFMKNVTLQLETLYSDSALFLTIIWADLTNVCINSSKELKVRVLDFTGNQIISLVSNCFVQSPEAQVLNLAKNKVAKISAKGFHNLNELKFLNLSANSLVQFSSGTFWGLTHLSVLSMIENDLSNLQEDMFKSLAIDLLEIDHPSVCCLVTSTTVCTAKFAWFQSCGDLLPSVVARWLFYIISAIILTFNAKLLILQRYLKTETKAGKAFFICVISLSICDMLYSLPFIIVWAGDIFLRGIFHVNFSMWKSSFWCFLAYFLFLNYNFLSPALLSFLSFSRVVVVLCPIKYTFLHTRQKKTFVLGTFTSFCVLSAIVTTLTKVLFRSVPLQHCTPFADPTGSVPIVKYYIFLQAVMKVLSISFIFTLHIVIVRTILSQHKLLQGSTTRKAAHFAMFFQLFILTSSTFLCWIPSSAIFLQSVLTSSHSVDLLLWITIVVTPLTAVVNPVVFIVTTMRKHNTSKRGHMSSQPPTARSFKLTQSYSLCQANVSQPATSCFQ